jgi:N-6 DNA Methylase
MGVPGVAIAARVESPPTVVGDRLRTHPTAPCCHKKTAAYAPLAPRHLADTSLVQGMLYGELGSSGAAADDAGHRHRSIAVGAADLLDRAAESVLMDICARIKQELLTKFNLHTIVRLPNGVFAPYTSIPTNLLFFDRMRTA